MSKIENRTFTPADVDVDGIAQAQTPAGAAALTLNGDLGTTLDYARILVITTVSNESAKTLTFVGKDADSQTITEVVTGPNATTGNTTKAYKVITSITASGAFTGTVTVGTTSALWGPTFPLPRASNFNTRFSAYKTGTINYDIQETYGDVQASDGAASVLWTSNAAAGKTANYEGTVYRASAMRVLINSYSSGATLKLFINHDKL